MAKTIAVILIDDFSDWELGPLFPGARYFLNCQVVTASMSGDSVRSFGGLIVTPDRWLTDPSVENADAWILPGSDRWAAPLSRTMQAGLRQRNEAGKLVAAIGAGTMALGQEGFLNNVPHTSNSVEYLIKNAPGYRGQAYFRDLPSVREALFVTAKAWAPVSFTADVFESIEPGQRGVVEEFRREFLRESVSL